MKKLALILTLVVVAGCSLTPGHKEYIQSHWKAVYFFKEESQLSMDEVKAHPEIVSVQTFEELKKYSQQKVALWIDKSATPFDPDEEKWINEGPQAYDPIVLIGTSDTLYAFKELLRLCCFLGPAGEYPGYDAPGFSVIQWKQTREPESPTTIFLNGYPQQPTVEAILEITDALLEGNMPETPTPLP